jgi:1,4-dihydroxy-2-naphthoyl-CoA hydrolase
MAFQKVPLNVLNERGKDTLAEYFGIEITEIADDHLTAKMQVTARTVQPMRILHGGATVAFAESLGSMAGMLCLPPNSNKVVVGLEINANHLRPVPEGQWIYGVCKPLHIGRSTMVFEIKVHNQEQKAVCASRISLAVINP